MKVRSVVAYITLFVLVFLSALSCKKVGGREKATRLAFDSLNVADTLRLVSDSVKSGCRFSVHIVLPTELDGDTSALQTARHEVVKAVLGDDYGLLEPRAAVGEYLKKNKEKYWTDAADFLAVFRGGPSDDILDNYLTIRCDTVGAKTGTIGFKITEDKYLGGAHGTYYLEYCNLDRKTGRRITEADVFAPGYEQGLVKAIVTQLFADNQVKTPEQLIEKGFNDVADLKLNGNFLLKNDGILYVFNEYEIAPYYVGTVTVFLPNDKIAHLLKK